MDSFFYIFLAFAIGVMWFMSSRTRKQQQEAVRFRDSLEAGQEVRTIGGMFGTVVEVEGDRVTLELSPGVTGQWTKQAIAMLVLPPVEDADADAEDDDAVDEDYEDYDEDSVGDEAGGEADEEWEDVEVPDDASSLTADKDEENPR